MFINFGVTSSPAIGLPAVAGPSYDPIGVPERALFGTRESGVRYGISMTNVRN